VSALIDRAPDFAGADKAVGRRHLRIGGIDIADFAQAQSVMGEVVSKFSGIDVLVNIAADFGGKPSPTAPLGPGLAV